MNAAELLGFDPRELWPGLKVAESDDADPVTSEKVNPDSDSAGLKDEGKTDAIPTAGAA